MTGFTLVAAACGDHLTLGDGVGMFGMLAGMAALFWVLTR